MKKLVILSAILVTTAGFAQTGTSGSSNPSSDSDAAEQNETICRIVTDTGSRLNRSRVCMTRAQWAEHRRETQQNAERTQMRRVPTQY